MKHRLTRREMIRISSLVTGGVCLCQTVSGEDEEKSTCCFTPDLDEESYSIGQDRIVIDLTKAAPLQDPGYAAQIINRDKNVQIIIVRSENAEYAAFQRFCTHGGALLSYNSTRQILQCNNYNHSIFDLNGQVVKGPAPRPLKAYSVKQDCGKLIVYLKNE